MQYILSLWKCLFLRNSLIETKEVCELNLTVSDLWNTRRSECVPGLRYYHLSVKSIADFFENLGGCQLPQEFVENEAISIILRKTYFCYLSVNSIWNLDKMGGRSYLATAAVKFTVGICKPSVILWARIKNFL